MGFWKACVLSLRALLTAKIHLAVENLALRQQLAVCNQSVKRPKLRPRDRIFWAVLSRLWPNWRSALAIVQPETVIRWHRKGFKLFWRWKSRAGRPGRPPIQREIRELIRRVSRENPTWGAPRIVSELALLGHDVAEGSVANRALKAAVNVAFPVGQWNTARLVVRGDSVEHWINGSEVIQYEFGTPELDQKLQAAGVEINFGGGKQTASRLALQGWEGTIWYRNIKLRPLEPEQPAPGPASVTLSEELEVIYKLKKPEEEGAPLSDTPKSAPETRRLGRSGRTGRIEAETASSIQGILTRAQRRASVW